MTIQFSEIVVEFTKVNEEFDRVLADLVAATDVDQIERLKEEIKFLRGKISGLTLQIQEFFVVFEKFVSKTRWIFSLPLDAPAIEVTLIDE